MNVRVNLFGRGVFSLCVWAVSQTASAQTVDATQALRQQVDALRADLERLQQEYQQRLAQMEAALAALQGAAGGTPATVGIAAAAAREAQAVAPAAGLADIATPPPQSSKVFNPDMAVVGNFLGVAGKNGVDPAPALEMRESEASFQAAVDPYARADFFLAFGESGVDLEEGFVTFPALPGGLLMKAGKMRAAFGKVNPLHTHALPWADRPLVTANLLGGEEGISDAGVSVARLISNPWLFLEATGQVFRGDSEGVFSSAKRTDLAYVGRLRAYRDVTESANVDLGVSYARGRSAMAPAGVLSADTIDASGSASMLIGADVTWRWRPLRRAIYRSFLGRSEVVWNRQDRPDGAATGAGYYVSGEYQFARRWFGGARVDRSDRGSDLSLRDRGTSLTLTYWPSAFSQVRSQYRRTAYADAPAANELLFQLQFSIGAHGAHPF